MKRIAALAAVLIGLLAIPAAAMASTGSSGGSGSGSSTTAQVQLQPKECYVGWHKVDADAKRYFDWWQNGREYTGSFCPFPNQIALPSNVCRGQALTFSVAADSHVMTEVSGPELWPTEQFLYDGNTYTIMSINPGADQFTAFVNNVLFTNSGAAITNATAVMVSCANF